MKDEMRLTGYTSALLLPFLVIGCIHVPNHPYAIEETTPIAPSELPTPVAQAISREFGQPQLGECHRVLSKGKTISFLVDIAPRSKRQYTIVEYLPDGRRRNQPANQSMHGTP